MKKSLWAIQSDFFNLISLYNFHKNIYFLAFIPITLDILVLSMINL